MVCGFKKKNGEGGDTRVVVVGGEADLLAVQ